MVMYNFNAYFAARICKDCPIRLSNATISFFRSVDRKCGNQPNIKEVLQEISEDDLKNLQKNLLGQGHTDDNGNVEIVIDSQKTKYNGECVELVITFDHIPSSGKKLESQEHFRVAFYTPDWRQRDNGFYHAAKFVLPANFWCAYLKKHGVWVICGQVTTCSKPASPFGNVTVMAHDVDWVQDDYLGSAVTDSAGRFFIYYDKSKFDRTPFSPFINVEWTGGPDVYFKIEGVDTEGHTVTLLDEPPSRGRQPDRENITNCFCVQLCIEVGTTQNPYEVPMWTHIGNYQIPDSASLHDFIVEGFTNSGNLAFYSNMEFIGQTGMATATKKIRYRFLYAKWTGMTPPVPTTPVSKDMIGPTKVGQIIASISPLVLEPVYVNKPSAAHNHDPDAAGWVEVEDDPMFTPIANKLITLISTKLAPGASYSNPSPNTDAGSPAPSDPPRTEQKFALRFQLEVDTGSGWILTHDQTMDALVINNAAALLWLELDEFISAPFGLCQPITNTVTVNYTVDHPHLDWYEVEIEKQGAHMLWPIPRVNHGGSLTFSGGNGSTPAINISAWNPCSYIVFLRAHRRVTNGYGGPGIQHVYRTFCKS